MRADIESLDATLLTQPVYGQVAQFAGGDRGIIDLLAVDRDGRLAVIELKVDQDIHLPLQALDYWMRVKWHLDRGEIAAKRAFYGDSAGGGGSAAAAGGAGDGVPSVQRNGTGLFFARRFPSNGSV